MLAGYRLAMLKNNTWGLGASFIALLAALPVLTVFSFMLQPSSEVWQHLVDTVLQDYITNSLLLMLGVAGLATVLGVSTAWLTSLCDFPGRGVFEWALLLPLAMPGYIVAFTYGGMLGPAGPAQTMLRELFAWSYGDYWFPEIHSLGGAICILGFVLYPYIYMLCRAAFLSQSLCVLEVSRTLGCSPWRSFLNIALPLARPAIVAGLTLVCMETLADYGTVQYLGISTFTTGIFRTWFGMGDAAAAGQLAAVLMIFIIALVVLERLSRRRARYHHTSNKYSTLPRYPLSKYQGLLACFACLIPLSIGFLLPAGQLLLWALKTFQDTVNQQFLLLLWNSLWLASLTALCVTIVALFLAYAQRIAPKPSVVIPAKVANLGYAVPGTVIAVGVMIVASHFDHAVINGLKSCCNISSGLILSGSFAALIFAYLVRFLSVSLQSVEAGLSKVKPSMDDAARALGYNALDTVKHIHFPIIRGTVLTALLLVFVDTLKELPATLVMRPFNFNTLAVKAYELASDERLADAASASLAIVIAGIIPVILLSKSITQSRPGQVKHKGNNSGAT